MFEPEAILYRVWQRDVPPGWYVYPRWRLRVWMVGCALSLLVIIAALLPLPFAPNFWLRTTAVFLSVILVAIVGGSLCLVVGARQGLDFPVSRNPDGVLVVTPEGVVEYVSTRVPIYTLPFAEIEEIERHREGERAWLEVISLDGSEAEWTPRARFGSKGQEYLYEEIFGRILEAFAEYRARGV